MVASSVDVEEEETIDSKEEVNSSSYLSFHNGQMFADGLSFSGFERNKLWLNGGDRMVDLSTVSGADTPNDSRAVIAADFDDDGDLDLFVHNIQRERHGLYRNDAVDPAERGFLKLRLRATSGHWEAIGATVRVTTGEHTVAQVMARGAGFVSCQVPELVFGLGGAPRGAVEVQWPDGSRESFGELAKGTRALLVQGSGAAEAVAALPRTLPDPLPPGLKLSEGDLVPRLSVVDAGGERRVVDLASFSDGKPMLVNFWASYCKPCVAEMPVLQAVEAQGDTRVLAISLDVAGDVPAAQAILERAGVSFEALYLDPAPPAAGADPDAGVDLREVVDLERLSLPTTLALSAEGRVESILRGPLTPAGGPGSGE